MAKNRDESAGSNSSTGSEILGAHAKQQSNKNVASSAIEFGARAFDLCSALVNASQPTSAIVRSTQDLLKWLARERVDEYSFTKCAEKARCLAYPNANGVTIRNQIEEADKRLHTVRGAPIGLLVSGSLGRLMARDADYCYIVSTKDSPTVQMTPRTLKGRRIDSLKVQTEEKDSESWEAEP